MFEVYAQDYRITIQEIPLGNQGEDMARCLVIDITDAVNEFGSGGTVSVRNKRNGDELPYFCTNVSTVTGADAEGNVHTYIKWTLTDVDTAAAGSGFVQADYIISGTTVKTWVYKYFILPSLGITGDVPDPYEDILEEIEAQVSAVQTAAASAAASAALASAEATRIISTTQQVVEDWLSDHIVTGYTVDDTLTISGAAADSATVGTQLRAAFVTEETSGSIASFADGADGVPLKDLVVNITPKQAGSGDPSPTNVRAVSGWTGANISRTGKNLFDVSKVVTNVGRVTNNGDGTLTIQTGSTSSSTLATDPNYLKSYADLKVGETYTLSGTSTGTNKFIYLAGANLRWDFGTSKTITQAMLDSRVNWYASGISTTATISELQIELGTVATAYEPYMGNIYNISFGTAGTVYGGTLDVTTGMLTVTHAYKQFSNLAWAYNSSYGSFYCYLNDKSTESMCDRYVRVGVWSDFLNADNAYWSAGTTLYVRDADYTTVNAFLAAMGNAQFVYSLAQPVSYQLTPTEVKSLLANNNIWSNTGSVASCEYRADTKLYLEKLTNPDDDMVANANITSGSYFMVNNNLYLATANIANGGAITPGTNCTATNLAAALNAINS